MENQYKLYMEIVEATDINIVTCGMCGDVVFHRMDYEIINCPHCKFEGEPCDFPDICYE